MKIVEIVQNLEAKPIKCPQCGRELQKIQMKRAEEEIMLECLICELTFLDDDLDATRRVLTELIPLEQRYEDEVRQSLKIPSTNEDWVPECGRSSA